MPKDIAKEPMPKDIAKELMPKDIAKELMPKDIAKDCLRGHGQAKNRHGNTDMPQHAHAQVLCNIVHVQQRQTYLLAA